MTEAKKSDQTRQRILDTGRSLVLRHGFSGVGLSRILSESGVPKGSFYHYFDSKEAFGQAVLQRYADYFGRKLDRWLLDETELPLRRIRHFVDDAKEGMKKHEFRRGCLVGNLGQEVLVLPESFRNELENILLDWQRRLADCLRQAASQRQICLSSNCDDLSAYFWIGWEGAVMRARLIRDAAPLEVFAAGFLAGITR